MLIKAFKKVLFLLLGLVLTACGGFLLWRFFPGAPLVYWPLEIIIAFAFLLGCWRPYWLFAFLLFMVPWLMAIPLYATGGRVHPMHIFPLLFGLGGLAFHELFEKRETSSFRGAWGFGLFLGMVILGAGASFLRYAPEWVRLGGFYDQVINDKDWTRRQALIYILFNVGKLISGLLLFFFAQREAARRENALQAFKKLWLFLAAGATLTLLAAIYQRCFNIEFLAHRTFYWMKMGRVNGACEDPNALGVVLGLTVIIGLSFLSARKKGEGFFFPLLVILWSAFSLVGINYSGSRSAFLAVILSLAFFLLGLFINTRKILPARPLVRVGICVLSLAILFGGAYFYSMKIMRQADLMLTGTTKSPALQRRLKKDIRSIRNAGKISKIFNDARRQVFPRYAREVASDTWPTGVGVGSFVTELPNYAKYEEETLRSVDNACNFYLQVEAELGLYGIVGLGFFMFGLLSAFLLAWFKWRANEEDLGEIWAAFQPLLIFALLLLLGVHQEALEVSIPWHIFLGFAAAFLTARAGGPLKLHSEAHFLSLVTLGLLLVAAFFGYRRLNAGKLNSERRLASICRFSEAGFYPWETWHAQSQSWRWCGKEGFICMRKQNEKLSFDLVSNRPDLEKRPLQVTVFINGTPQTNVVLSVPGEKKTLKLSAGFSLPFDAVTDQHTALRLSCSETWKPKDYGAENDERELGVAMSHVRWSLGSPDDEGIYPKETDESGRVFAWIGERAFFEDVPKKYRTLNLSLRALTPFLRFFPIEAAIYVNGAFLDNVELGSRSWRNYTYDLPTDIPRRKPNRVEILVSRCWNPRHYGFDDDRSLGLELSLPSWQEKEEENNSEPATEEE